MTADRKAIDFTLDSVEGACLPRSSPGRSGLMRSSVCGSIPGPQGGRPVQNVSSHALTKAFCIDAYFLKSFVQTGWWLRVLWSRPVRLEARLRVLHLEWTAWALRDIITSCLTEPVIWSSLGCSGRCVRLSPSSYCTSLQVHSRSLMVDIAINWVKLLIYYKKWKNSF